MDLTKNEHLLKYNELSRFIENQGRKATPDEVKELTASLDKFEKNIKRKVKIPFQRQLALEALSDFRKSVELLGGE